MSDVNIEFAPEVEQALLKSEGYTRAEGSKSHKVSFDGAGSIHLVDYDEEGKKLQDYTLGEKRKKSPIDVPEGRNQEIVDQINYYKRSSKISKILFGILIGVLTLGMLCSIYVIKQVGG